VARHRSPRGRHAHPTRSLPFIGTDRAEGARRGPLLPPVAAVRAVDLQALRAQAARLAAVRVVRPPDTVLRGVALATVAAVGVTGAGAALAGRPDAAPVLPEGAAAVVPAPGLVPAAGRAALTLPVPEAAVPGVPGTGGAVVPAPAVLDPDTLRRAVARAQDDARRLAERDRRAAVAEAAQADDDQDEDADERAEEERTAERARRAGRAADPAPESAADTSCDLNTGQLGAVRPHVRAAAEFLGCAFDEPTVLGVAGRSNASDHPKGRALDFMVDRATGDRLAACALRNREALGVSYVIWRQRIDTGDGFRPMPDRGSPTANHFDHVHVSFDPSAGTGDPTTC
jgi:hypothetical protein